MSPVRPLLGLLLGCSLSVQAVAAPVAIGCEGSWYEEDSQGNGKKTSSQYRIYVFDEAKSTLDYWNEDREVLIPMCDSTWLSCSINFEPTQIKAEAKLTASYTVFLNLSRRSGLLQYVTVPRGSPTKSYYGDCENTEMPQAMTAKNKF